MPDTLPHLPVIQPPPPRRTQTQKFGAALYLGLAGLGVLTLLLGWFGFETYRLRNIWKNVYIINDSKRSTDERVQAAIELANDRQFTPRQRWDLALSRVPPYRARYILAESLGEEVIKDDPEAYALSVARSQGWPDWLRLMLVRPLAYGAERYTLPAVPLEELRLHHDEAIRLWATYAKAVALHDATATDSLRLASSSAGAQSALAKCLMQAFESAPRSQERTEALDDATRLLRSCQADSARIWQDPSTGTSGK